MTLYALFNKSFLFMASPSCQSEASEALEYLLDTNRWPDSADAILVGDGGEAYIADENLCFNPLEDEALCEFISDLSCRWAA